jgi:hypothetical protein
MKKHSFYFAAVWCALIMAGCSMTMRVQNDTGTLPDSNQAYSADAHGSFYNWNDNGIKKTYRAPDKAGRAESVGTDYVGQKDFSVTYRLTYWDSLLAVLSLGLYVPVSIEYEPVRKQDVIPDNTTFIKPESRRAQ